MELKQTGVASRPNYPWILIGLLWMAAFLNSADRSILVAVMPEIRTEFDLSLTQLGLLNSIFFWVYAAAVFFTGQLGDGARRSRVIIYGLVFWSIATGLVPLTTGFIMLLGLRSVVAAGESTYYPSATALISDWHKPIHRSRALSLHQTGVFAGAGVGALVAGYMADQFGWRMPFIFFFVLGLVVAGTFLLLLKDAPIRHTAAEKIGNAGRSAVRLVFKIRPAVMLFAVFFLANGASTGVTVWAPTYVHDALGLDLGSSALYGSATINLAGFLTVPLGGFLADTLAKRSPIGRFHTLAIGLAIAALLLLPLAYVNSAAGVGAVLLATSFGKGLFDGCIYAAMHDVVPPRARATAVGVMTTCGFIGAGLTPLAVAWAAESFGMAMGITSLAILYVAAVLILFLGRATTQAAAIKNAQEIH